MNRYRQQWARAQMLKLLLQAESKKPRTVKNSSRMSMEKRGLVKVVHRTTRPAAAAVAGYSRSTMGGSSSAPRLSQQWTQKSWRRDRPVGNGRKCGGSNVIASALSVVASDS